MNKKFIILIIIIFAVIAAVLGVAIYLIANRIDMAFVKKAEVRFMNGDANVLCRLDDEELDELKGIFDGKILYRDNPSCGFSETVSIKFNESQTFCIARDTCPVVYWMEKDKYIKLAEHEKIQLYSLLESYGFYFPCV